MYKNKLILENHIWAALHVNLSVVKLYQITLTSSYSCLTGSIWFSIDINSFLYCWFPCYFLKWPFHIKMEDPVWNITFYYFLSFIQNLLEYKSKMFLLIHYSPSWMDSSPRKWKHKHPIVSQITWESSFIFLFLPPRESVHSKSFQLHLQINPNPSLLSISTPTPLPRATILFLIRLIQ